MHNKVLLKDKFYAALQTCFRKKDIKIGQPYLFDALHSFD